MGINATFTTNTGDQTSVTSLPGNDISSLVIEGSYTGTIILQKQITSGSKWFTEDSFESEEVAKNIVTPDSAITFRFLGRNIIGTPRVYLGP